MQKAKFLDVNDEDDVKILDNISAQSSKNNLNIWDKNFISKKPPTVFLYLIYFGL